MVYTHWKSSGLASRVSRPAALTAVRPPDGSPRTSPASIAQRRRVKPSKIDTTRCFPQQSLPHAGAHEDWKEDERPPGARNAWRPQEARRICAGGRMHLADRAGTDRTYLLESAHVCSPPSCARSSTSTHGVPKLLASSSPAPARLLLRPSTQSSRKMEERRKLTPVRPQNRSLRGGGTATKRCILQRVSRPPAALDLPLHSGMTLAIRGLIGTHTSLQEHQHCSRSNTSSSYPNGQTDAKVRVAGRAAPEARPEEQPWVKTFSSSSPMPSRSPPKSPPPRSPRSPKSPRTSPPSTAESPPSTSSLMVGIEFNTAIPGVEGATLVSVDALETLRRRLPDGHPAVAKSMVELGKLYQMQGEWLS